MVKHENLVFSHKFIVFCKQKLTLLIYAKIISKEFNVKIEKFLKTSLNVNKKIVSILFKS